MDSSKTAEPTYVLPNVALIRRAEETLQSQVPATGLGLDAVQKHLMEDVAPALNASSRSSRYYGFVTGGATPAAIFADNMVTEFDQNVQVHLPNETIATNVEDAALRMVCDLVDLDPEHWNHRTFTTGATAANIIGLACAREYVISTAAKHNNQFPRDIEPTVSSHGLHAAMGYAGIDEIQILTSAPHSSLKKAASIVGLGHASVKDMGHYPSGPHRFDLEKLEQALKESRVASIIAISCSEVNSGLFATFTHNMIRIRELADQYGAWIHVDAAFGLLARILPPDDPLYNFQKAGVGNIEYADSIAADAHKLFNVPYDCGIFLSRHLKTGTAVFQNPGAPYLNAEAGSVPSPLNIGIENSRRFRALPVYANLLALGRQGFEDMLKRQIELARTIAKYVNESDFYELLPPHPHQDIAMRQTHPHTDIADYRTIYIIVLFRLKNPILNASLVRRINGSGTVYVSGTTFESRPACRFAISNWQSSVAKDWKWIQAVLDLVASGHD